MGHCWPREVFLPNMYRYVNTSLRLVYNGLWWISSYLFCLQGIHLCPLLYFSLDTFSCNLILLQENIDYWYLLFRYAALAPLYYRGAAVAVIVYDITSPESFNKAQYWVKVFFLTVTKTLTVTLKKIFYFKILGVNSFSFIRRFLSPHFSM